MPTKIILIRHGETNDNVNSVLQGWKDSVLTNNGHKQAKLLASSLKGVKVDAIYTSDLSRTCQTAQYTADILDLPLKKSKNIREHNLGNLEGVNTKNFEPQEEQLWLGFLHAREEEDFEWKGHEGESMNEFYMRLRSFFEKLSIEHKDQTVILVTHGGTKNRILEILKLKEKDYISFGNTSITTLMKTAKGGYKIVSLDDASHLK